MMLVIRASPNTHALYVTDGDVADVERGSRLQFRPWEMLAKYPDACMTGRAVWATIAQTTLPNNKCSDLFYLLGVPKRILDRPVADAIFALAATENCQAVLQYIKMIPK